MNLIEDRMKARNDSAQEKDPTASKTEQLDNRIEPAALGTPAHLENVIEKKKYIYYHKDKYLTR